MSHTPSGHSSGDARSTGAEGRPTEAVERQLRAQALAEDMMIHDVRNPLSSIISIADMLSTRSMSDDTMVWIERIAALGHRALQVLKASSGYAQMERDDYELEIGSFDLLASVQATFDKLKALSDRYSVTHRLLLDDREIDHQQTMVITADQFFVEQMLHNLFTNALESSSPGESVKVAIRSGNPLVISVHNSGVISEDVRDEIFDKLASYQQERGSGLGAYIAKLVAEQHRGTLSFTTSEEQGTVFRVTLPQGNE